MSPGRQTKEERVLHVTVDGCRRIKVTSSHEGLNIDLQGRARHGELKLGDNIRVYDSKFPNALTFGKDLSTATRKESSACKEREKNQYFFGPEESIGI